MAEIFEFPPCGDEGAPAAGSRKELLAYLASVEEQIDQLNQHSPLQIVFAQTLYYQKLE